MLALHFCILSYISSRLWQISIAASCCDEYFPALNALSERHIPGMKQVESFTAFIGLGLPASP